ncbi:MAG: cell division protein [Rhodospirillales bacterium]|jgi:cell division transport system permease protein|nr:cell division protein [Rhodospirillales bacterium]
MLNPRTDLPLDRDSHGRFLPWIIAFVVFLASLALAGTLFLDSLAAGWERGVSATLSVQIPASGDEADDDRRTDAALIGLRSAPGVVRADLVSAERVAALLEPWLGPATAAGDLPLPRLIDVEIDDDVEVAELTRALQARVPDATIDDHRVWLDRLVRLVRAIELLAGATLALMSAATAGTVVFATRTGLAVHQDVIEVLHLIGAQDAYIARQFARRAQAHAIRGAAVGLALAVPTLGAIGYLATRLEPELLPELSLSPIGWSAFLVLPLAAAAIAAVTARLTVIRSLARMP